MFGYKLKLVKKDDLVDLEVLKASIKSIEDITSEFGDFMTSEIDLDMETIRKITEFNDDLGVYVDIYFNNKFSLPSNSLSMYQVLNTIRRNSMVIIDAINEYNKLQSVENKYNERFKNGDSYDDETTYGEHLAIASELQRGYQQVNNTMGLAAANIISGLLLIANNVRGDQNRINSGLDIVRDYKRRKKLKINKEQMDSKFSVQYVLHSRSDKEFVLKENVKNGKKRSGTRTADGGSEETV